MTVEITTTLEATDETFVQSFNIILGGCVITGLIAPPLPYYERFTGKPMQIQLSPFTFDGEVSDCSEDDLAIVTFITVTEIYAG